MIIQKRLTSRSSRSLAVMIGFAQPAGSRGTWRSDGDIDGGPLSSALASRSSAALSPQLLSPFCSNRHRAFHALRAGTPRLAL
jgi:hypothetical protein